MRPARRLSQLFALLTGVCAPAFAQDDGASLHVSGGNAIVDVSKTPGAEKYEVLGTTDLTSPFNVLGSGTLSGFTWTGPANSSQGFYRTVATPMAPNDLMAGLLLNRLAYGPTPDELERIKQIGPDAWIAEQLAPESISETLDIDLPNTNREWQRMVITGTATAVKFYMYLTAPGDVYLDDLKIVSGTQADVGANLFANGGFEAPLTAWTISPNLIDSAIVTTEAHTGASSLHIVANAAGSTEGSSIWQNIPGVVNGQVYTLSYWWKPGVKLVSNLTMRFSNDGLKHSPDTLATKLVAGQADIDDLRAWHALHAVRSKKQLQEVLLQFLENHFVTQYSKSKDYFDRYYDDGEEDLRAVNTEYREIQRWRQALNKPDCTFSNLLAISTESPAQIIYLDTVNSRGNGSNIPNENYAREILELFSMGVDNGYDQTDITLLSRVWTGWTVEIVDQVNELNPLAARSTTLRPGGTNIDNRENLEGIWAFNYKSSMHWDQGSTILFPGKKVDPRFGAPYAGRDYTLPIDVSANVSPDWQKVEITGNATSSTLYMYLAGPGDIYLDDISIEAAANPGVNLVVNGGFESNLTGWTVAENHITSSIETTGAHGGTRALHMRATSGGSTQGSSISKTGLGLTVGQPYKLTFWWKPGTAAGSSVTFRLSNSSNGNGIFATAPPRLVGDGLAEGYKVVGHLSDLPYTQEFISVKLCRLFVHDHFEHGVYNFTDPNLSAEGKLVRACMDAWENNTPKGQIRKVLKVIFDSELFRSQGAASHKVKTPFEFTVSAVRALRSQNTDGTFTSNTDGYALTSSGNNSSSPLVRMGAMRLFDRAEPDGYPEAAAPWISAGTLAERLRWVQSLCIAQSQGGRGDAANSFNDPVALVRRKLATAQWYDAGAVADYFLGILFPCEGKANLDLYRQAAIQFLNTADNGTGASNFSGLATQPTVYDTRVRGMVSALMTSPRFHEQ